MNLRSGKKLNLVMNSSSPPVIPPRTPNNQSQSSSPPIIPPRSPSNNGSNLSRSSSPPIIPSPTLPSLIPPPIPPRIKIRLPSFDENVGEVWINQATILLKGLPDDLKKIKLIEALPTTFLFENGIDLVLPYNKFLDQIKNKLILDPEEKMNALLDITEIGDQKPSSILRKLCHLANGNTTLALWKFKKLLPIQCKPIIIAMENDHKTLFEIGNMTDKIIKNENNTTISAVQTERKDKKIILNSNNQSTSDICWYHQQFGSKAKKCAEGCKFFNSENCKRQHP